MWIPAQTTVAALGDARASAAGTSSPAGAKMIAASSSSGGAPGAARPLGAELARERLRVLVARAREREQTRRPCARATCATMCAAAPKP